MVENKWLETVLVRNTSVVKNGIGIIKANCHLRGKQLALKIS